LAGRGPAKRRTRTTTAYCRRSTHRPRNRAGRLTGGAGAFSQSAGRRSGRNKRRRTIRGAPRGTGSSKRLFGTFGNKSVVPPRPGDDEARAKDDRRHASAGSHHRQRHRGIHVTLKRSIKARPGPGQFEYVTGRRGDNQTTPPRVRRPPRTPATAGGHEAADGQNETARTATNRQASTSPGGCLRERALAGVPPPGTVPPESERRQTTDGQPYRSRPGTLTSSGPAGPVGSAG